MSRGDHVLLTWSDLASSEEDYEKSKSWAAGLEAQVRGSGKVTEAGLGALAGRDVESAERLMGAKWRRAMELKKRFDPGNVFGHAVPTISKTDEYQ